MDQKTVPVICEAVHGAIYRRRYTSWTLRLTMLFFFCSLFFDFCEAGFPLFEVLLTKCTTRRHDDSDMGAL